ncbi:hypothetical protein [Tenacibaculum discolor]|uniref:hypothetical protein n=1 Tax=Tenacibaculum discolor TaxID=361581 RepID=UPI003F78BB8F
MIKKTVYFFISTVLVSCVFLGCLPSKKKKNLTKENLKTNIKDSSSTETPFYIDISINNDTLIREKQKGFVKFFYKLDDTLKIVPKDEREIYLVLTLAPKGENKGKYKPSNKIKKELNFNPINPNDTILIPFDITPHFLGKAKLIGLIADTYVLHSYDKEKVRLLTYEQMFEKDVFIK